MSIASIPTQRGSSRTLAHPAPVETGRRHLAAVRPDVAASTPEATPQTPDLTAGPVYVDGADPFTHEATQWQFSPMHDEDGSVRMIRLDWSPRHPVSSWLIAATVTVVLPLDCATELAARLLRQ